eukprot:CAMPEP_0178442312 /NCGR_PEP_ID=MMETSP0689_2-20121128/38075_1 /TAXON_ID=160604 /ORGANISM="Amphidinium massartii, Strain CS-259" /LENGTH=219 /DNA_ID=CAMNT_0020065805 /DNA_START=61 /DNA_END=721 /DNA_ORIENTATION=-
MATQNSTVLLCQLVFVCHLALLYTTAVALRDESSDGDLRDAADGVLSVDVEVDGTVGLPDCATAAKQMYVGDVDRRFMTETSCMRANVVKSTLSSGNEGCYWAYRCQGKRGLGVVRDKQVCFNESTVAIGFCADDGPKVPPGRAETNDLKPFFGNTIKDYGESEEPEDQDPQLQPGPDDKPWERAAARCAPRAKRVVTHASAGENYATESLAVLARSRK